MSPSSHVDLRLDVASEAMRTHAAAIAESVSATWGGPAARPVAVACRRRPAHRACGGLLCTQLDEERIGWTCPRCRDRGSVGGWVGSRHDLSAVRVQGEDSGSIGWLAAIVTPDEYRALADERRGFRVVERRIIRAARPTRPGIRIEAPAEPFDRLIIETADRALGEPPRRFQTHLRSVWHRFCDARNTPWALICLGSRA